MSEQDNIGTLGEGLAELSLNRLFRRQGRLELSYFRTTFLGEKYPTVDLLLQLEGVGLKQLFAVAQVKSTAETPKHPTSRLRVRFEKDNIARLLRCCLPSYLIAVDVTNEKVYLAAATPKLAAGLTSFPRDHELNAANLRLLWNEIRTYWMNVRRPRRHSHFSL